MDVVSVCPLRTGSILWQPRRGAWVLTVVCKATYDLVPIEALLAHDQEYPNDDDNHWNDDPARSLYSPSDLVPFKAKADVLLVGHAFAPRGEPARSIVARIVVGALHKAIEVFGERAWTHDGLLREGPRVAKVPIRYERAAGGPETSNPVGIRPDVADGYGVVALPNLQPAGVHVSSRGDRVDPIGFGPIAPAWPGRRDKLGPKGASWSDAGWQHHPLPEGFDSSYFNAAPPDQQIEELRANEHLTLENLHPEHPRLVTNLPGVQPCAFVERPGTAPQELGMRADTLWIDTDRSVCTLTWRGQVALDHPLQPGRVVVAMEAAGKRVSWLEVERLAGPWRDPGAGESEFTGTLDIVAEDLGRDPPTARGSRTDPPLTPPAVAPPASQTGASPLGAGVRAPMPFVAASSGVPPAAQPVPGPAAATNVVAQFSSGLPFVAPSGSAVAPSGSADAAAPRPEVAGSPPAQDAGHPEASAPAPGDASPPWLTQFRRPSATASVPPPAPPPLPPGPSFAAQAPMPPPVASLLPDSPWAAGGALPQEANVPSSSVGHAPASPTTVSSHGLSSSPSSSPAAPPAPVAHAAGGSVIAASNAAAATNPWATGPAPLGAVPGSVAVQARAPARPTARDVVDLLWFDPETVADIRDHERWKGIVKELSPPPVDLDFDDEPPAPVPRPVRDRRDVFAIMTRAEPADAEGIQEAIAGAVSEDGTFAPPLVLVAGELHFPFDELETLKATVTAVTPLIAGDKKLKETVDTVNELLKTPWLQSSSGVAEGLTARVKEAFAQGNRMLPASYLDSHTDRMLLEQRHYQKRTVFGALWIRSVLLPAGSQTPVPVYLPERLTKELPMFQRMRARLIAQAHMQQDEYENHPAALKVVALGRVVSLSARRRDGKS